MFKITIIPCCVYIIKVYAIMPVAQYLTINIDNVQFTSFIFYSMVTQRYFTNSSLLPTFCVMLARDRLLKMKNTLSCIDSDGTTTSSLSFCPASRVSMLVALAMDAGWKQQIYKIHSHFAHKRLLKQFMQRDCSIGQDW